MNPRVDVLGLPVDRIDRRALLDRVGAAVAARQRLTVAYLNVHVVHQAARHADLAAFLRGCDLVYADGGGVVWASRHLGDPLPERMTGADWIEDFARRAAREGWRVGWIGGAYGVTAQAARALQTRHPRLRSVWTGHGYPRGDRGDAALIDTLNAAKLDVLLVGMGTPVQERWVAARRDRLDVPVVWCLGATADFVSGRVSRGPRWLFQRQEWLARLIVDPLRLWRRYLLGNPRFVWRVLRAKRRG